MLAAALLLTCCAPRPGAAAAAAAAEAGTRKHKSKNHSNFFHSLIRRLGGNNTCQPKAKKRCKPHEVWFDKAGVHQPPTPNGCGTHDVKVKLARHGNFTPCCNEHDICYATCGHRTKSECDEVFRECMVAHCHAAYEPPPGLSTAASSTHARGKRMAMHLQHCLGEASLYYSGVYSLACGAYKRAQLRHCACRLRAHVDSEEEAVYANDSDSDSDSEDEGSNWEDEDWDEEEFDEQEREEWKQEMGEMMLEDEGAWEWSDEEWSDDESEGLVAIEIE